MTSCELIMFIVCSSIILIGCIGFAVSAIINTPKWEKEADDYFESIFGTEDEFLAEKWGC